MRQLLFLFTISCLFLLSGCQSRPKSTTAFTREVYTPTHAKGFDITGAENMQSTIVHVRNPWKGAEDVEMSYFIARNDEIPPRDFNGVVIPAGAKRIVCMSSSYIAMLDAFGQVNRVVGVSGIHFITNPYINQHKDEIKDMGAEINYELLVGLNPDLVLLYGIGDAQSTVTDKLKELHIPYMYVAEYMEESPLGKAEWMVALAELTDCREAGKQAFQGIPERYNAMKELAANATHRPTVMLNTPWQDSWFMPSVKSYIARLISDAGGDYIYKKNTSNGAEAIGLETAYELIRKADVWLNVGSAISLDELKAVNPNFKDAKAIQTNSVYNNNLRRTPGGGNDYWESGSIHPDIVLRDLIKILHPELVTEELYYFRHLE